MLTDMSAVVGFVGVGVSVVAYLPQILHLFREHCAAGISQQAYYLWIASSVLITFHAITTASYVFILLGIIQAVSSLIILIFSIKHTGTICSTHINDPTAQVTLSGSTVAKRSDR